MPHVTTLENQSTDVTTTFRGALAVEMSDPKATTFAPPSYVAAMTTDFQMTLKKTLCRPIQIASGTWSSSDAVGTVEFSGALPELLLDLPVIYRKLDGFQGIRGSITVRLLATANPFQQGLLKLIFYPMFDYDSTQGGRFQDPSSWSFLPSVELNLGKETACEMRIPFALPVTFCDLVTNTATLRPQMGQVLVMVYNQLKVASGSSSVSWNMYAHWNEDDLELFNPTPNSFQSGSHKVAAHTKLPAEAEKKSTSISQSLDAGATVARMATAVPVLASVAGPAEWALRAASRVAAALGFSRFPIDEKPRIVSSNALPYYTNVEGPDVSMPLAMTVQPSLKLEPKLVGKTEDEMTIDAFVTRFGYLTTVNLTAVAAGTNIFNFACGPYQHTGPELSYPKPHQMLGLMFNFWRGNMRVRVKFVKTKMHTGRLMFCFFPGVITAQNLTQAEYVHREIVDLASIEELTYELPFTAQTPYLGTQQGGLFGSYGSFQIIVVNTLQAPPTVANNIDLIIETAMGEGSEWFSPAPIPALYPLVPSGTLVVSKTPPSVLLNKPQSGGSSVAVITTLADAKVVGHQVETAQLCVGEKLLSLRQLVKLPCNLPNNLMFSTQTVASNGFTPAVYFNPFLIGGSTGTGAGTAVRTKDFLGLLGPYFRFNRGCMRVKGYVSTTPSSSNVPIANSTAFGYVSAGCRPPNASNVGMFGQDVNPSTPACSDVQPLSDGAMVRLLMPPWQTSTMVPIQYALTTTVSATSLYLRSNSLSLMVGGAQALGANGGAVTFSCVRQPADDYELLMFIGPPKFTSAT